MRHATIPLLALLLTSCDACSSGKERESIKLSCEDTCIQGAMASFDRGACEDFCFRNLDPGVVGQKQYEQERFCKDYCDTREQNTTQLTTMGCTFRCQQDPDDDRILGAEDLCPETPLNTLVASDGCPDSDGDGYSDRIDKCPQEGTPEEVDLHGCLLGDTSCDTAYCAADKEPSCGDGLDCDKQLEIPLSKRIPVAKRIALARQLLSLRPHPKNCPGTQGGVPAPAMIKPSVGVTPVEAGVTSVVSAEVRRVLGLVYFKREGERLVPLAQDKTATEATPGRGAYQELDLEVHFSTVDASCPVPPDGYSLFIEYYYCDKLPGVDEMRHLQELGFCRWHPLDYVSGLQGGQPFFYTVKTAELFAKLYSPHISHPDLSQSFQGEKIGFNYKKLWLRFQAVAHDGNGQSSAIGMHQDMAYVVLYMAGFNKAYELVKIPGESHH